MILTEEQKNAVTGAVAAINAGAKVAAITGPAGTGKSTCLSAVTDLLPDVVLCTPTWRAAGIAAAKTGKEAITLHSATKRPKFLKPLPALTRWLEKRGEVPHPVKVRWPDADWDSMHDEQECFHALGIKPMDWVDRWVPKEPTGKVLLVDEASMLGVESIAIAQVVYDAIILVGDPKQLEPVKDTPVLHLVPDELTFKLTTIHRQAEGSPVLTAAYHAYDTGQISAERELYTRQHATDGIPVICWRNATRQKRTEQIRAMLGYPEYMAVAGEPLVCRAYRQSDRDRGLVNNTLWTVQAEHRGKYLIVNDEGLEVEVKLAMEELDGVSGVPFRFGYALTAHTAQGGEWPVVGIDADDARIIAYVKKDQAKTWAYTSVTRAKERVFLVGGIDA